MKRLPRMVAHAGNNAAALLVGMNGVELGRLDWWVYVLAAACYALSFYILYRHRTPYPGLK